MDDLTRRDFLASCASVAALTIFPQENKGLAVHEWGVVSVPSGTSAAYLRTAGVTALRGIEKAPALPAFVTTWEAAVKDAIEQWKNEPAVVFKPVVYFYTRERTTANVTVSIPTGRPGAWWPRATFGPLPKFPPKGRLGDLGQEPEIEEVEPKNGLLRWIGLDVDPAARPSLTADGWWPLARKTDATSIRVGNDVEKFLFYDAVADWTPSPVVTWTKEGVTVTNGSGLAYRAVVALRVRNGECASAISGELAKGAATLLTPAKGLPDLATTLIAAGLYKKEAESLVEIWTDEFFKTDGVRVLLVLSREAYDAFLPLEIQPTPADIARVLIAHVECLDEERVARIRGWIDDLGSGDIETRDRAATQLRQLGPLAKPVIREAADKATDAEVKSRLAELLK